VIVGDCGKWVISYDLDPDTSDALRFKVFIGGNMDPALTVDRRSRIGYDGYGVPSGEESFELYLAHTPRITVEDFADYSSRNSFKYGCPSSGRWVGEVTLTDPTGEVHVLGNGLTEPACGDYGWADSGKSDILTCAQLDIDGQELPSKCGLWVWSYDFDRNDESEGFTGTCAEDDLGFKIKVDGVTVIEVNSDDNYDGWEAALEDQRTATSGGGEFIVSGQCDPSAQPSGQPHSTGRK
jgi:hypothetical protein